jgi:spermidine synthase
VRQLIGLCLLSVSGFLFQIAMTRVASAALNYHLAFFVVSAALLGTGAGGTWVALRQRPHDLRLLAIGSAAGMALVSISLSWVPLRLAGSAQVLVGLLIAYPVLVLPYVFQGAAIAVALREAGRQAGGRVGFSYGAVLVGGAVGAMLSLASLDLVGPRWTLVLASVAAGTAAAWFGPLRMWWVASAGTIAVSALAVVYQPFSPNVLQTKPLATFLNPITYPDASLLHTHWDSVSRVDVFEALGAPLLWGTRGAGLTGLPGSPQARGITIDADALTAALAAGDGRSPAIVFNLATSLPYAVAERERVLVIGPGGGVDVEAALAHGARSVDAVEVNKGVAKAMLGPLSAYTGDLYRRPQVRLIVQEGRSYVRRAPPERQYDTIVLTAVDSWAALGAGAYSLAESYLYTDEAFGEYYDRLAPGGVLSVSRWYTSPPREFRRLTEMAARAVESRGENPSRSILLVRSGQFGTFGTLLVRKGPFPQGELTRARAFARVNGFGLAYDPMLHAGGLGDLFVDDFAGAGTTLAVDRAPRDDRPFFFDFVSWTEVLRGQVGRSQLPLGHAVLLITLVQSGCLAVAATFLPVRRLGATAPRRQKAAAAAYFAAIGVGFMLAEMALLQRLTLVLGLPTLAFAVTVGGMLTGAGLGSTLSAGTSRRFMICLVTAGIGLLAIASFWPAVLRLSIWLPQSTLIILGLGITAPVAVLMGTALPSGLRLMLGGPQTTLSGMVPWAWGINGAASVFGASLSVLLAMEFGITTVLIVAGGCYLVSAALVWWSIHSPDQALVLHVRRKYGTLSRLLHSAPVKNTG